MQIPEELKAEHDFENHTRVDGFLIADLRRRFDTITHGMPNWKMPFSVQDVMGEDVMLTVRAITYFTGDNAPRVTLNTETMRYAVATIGYYRATGEC